MPIQIKSIRNIVQNKGIKILVHGLAGSGKTVLCCTAGEPTLLISAESGLLSVRDAPKNVKGVEVSTIQDLYDLYDWLVEDSEKPEGPRFKWVALDSITEIAERVLSYEKGLNNDPRKAYMNMQDEIMKILRKYRDIPHYHVVMSCKQVRGEDEGKKLYLPMMPGQKLGSELPYLFDEVFALRVETDENQEVYRVLQTNRDAKYEAKDRSGALDFFEKPSLKHIAKKILASLDEERDLPGSAKEKSKKDSESQKNKAALDEALKVEDSEEDSAVSSEEDQSVVAVSDDEVETEIEEDEDE